MRTNSKWVRQSLHGFPEAAGRFMSCLVHCAASVLFSDVVSFTTMASNISAERLVSQPLFRLPVTSDPNCHLLAGRPAESRVHRLRQPQHSPHGVQSGNHRYEAQRCSLSCGPFTFLMDRFVQVTRTWRARAWCSGRRSTRTTSSTARWPSRSVCLAFAL